MAVGFGPESTCNHGMTELRTPDIMKMKKHNYYSITTINIRNDK